MSWQLKITTGPLLVPTKSTFGWSEYGFAVVNYEPVEEQFALYRFFFAALIIIYSLISQYHDPILY